MALPLRLADYAVFDSFLSAGNESLVATLDDLACGRGGQGCWLWGAAAVGKTHLLQAVCDQADDRSVYVPLRMLLDVGPDILRGLESRDVICMDDIDAVAGNALWEEALFALCNQVFDADRIMIVSATMSPRECPIALADLQSRLVRLPIFQVHALAENDRLLALKLRAKHRGLDLPDDTASYLLSRSRRDMASLYSVLDQLDLEALRAQRRLTIPFVKSVLES